METPSVLDLVFTKGQITSRFHNQQTINETGLDHLGVFFTIDRAYRPYRGGETPKTEIFDYLKADWEKFRDCLREKSGKIPLVILAQDTPLDRLSSPSTAKTDFLDLIVEDLTTII